MKNAIISPTEIVIFKKKGNIIIKTEEIEQIEYSRPTLWNFIVKAPALGYLRISIKGKLFKDYYIRIKFRDVMKLPEFYLRKIDPTNIWGSWY